MHLDFVRPSGVFPNESVPGAADYQKWDVGQNKFADGVNGGTYTPTAPIIVGGAGLKSVATTTLIGGGVTTKTGGRIVLGSGFPVLSPAINPVRVVRMWDIPYQLGVFSGAGAGNLADAALVLSVPPAPMGVSLAPGGLTSANVNLPISGRYLFHGLGTSANILSFAVNFRVTSKPPTVPTNVFYIGMFVESLTSNVSDGIPSLANIATYFTTWAPATVMTLNHYSGPVAAPNGLYYKATTVVSDAKTGGSEPAWPLIIGNTVVDNHVTWTCIGGNGHMSASQTVDQYYNNGQPQTVTYLLDPTLQATLRNDLYMYSMALSYLDPTILLHSMTFSFTGATAMGFG
jgi:hypothetical protein